MKSTLANPVINVDHANKTAPKTASGGLARRNCVWSNRWLVIGVSLLVVTAVVIGISIGVTRSRSKKSKAPALSNPASATQQVAVDDIYHLPSPEQYNPADWEGLVVDTYKQLNDSTYLTPSNIGGFVTEARLVLQQKLDVALPEHLGSAKNILRYLQATQQFGIIDDIVGWAAGRNLSVRTVDELKDLAKKLQDAFNVNSMIQFDKGQSLTHQHVGSESLSSQEVLKRMNELGFDMSDVATEDIIAPQKDGTGGAMRSAQPRVGASPRKLSAPPPKPNGTSPKRKFSFPALTIPVVFHYLQYISTTYAGRKVALPPTYDANKATQNIISEVNKLFSTYNTNVQFRIAEVHTDVKQYPYLLLQNVQQWQRLAAVQLDDKGAVWVAANNAAVDKYINILIAGSNTIPQVPCEVHPGEWCPRGYAWVPPIGTCATTEQQKWQHVLLQYDEVNPAWYNRDWGGYVPGAIVLAHELGHHLGLLHTHAGPGVFPYGCSSPNDGVVDTAKNDDAQLQPWWREVDEVCANFLSGVTTDWAVVTKKFDSCPKAPGTDAIFNIMSYSPDSCRNSRHMALTPGQVLLMQMKMLQCRPRLVACASGANKKCYP